MRLEIVPFSEEYLESAAELLAARHRADRTREPDLPRRFEDPPAAREVLQALMQEQAAGGVVALHGGRAVGYLMGSLTAPPCATYRPVTVQYAGVAVDPVEEGIEGPEVYRQLYAAVAPQWVAAGCFAHYVSTPARDRGAVDAWFSLDFGQDNILAVRDTLDENGVAVASDLEIRRAGPGDIDTAVRLEDGLRSYQAGAPAFIPYPPERRAGLRSLNERLLSDPAIGFWLAYRRDRAVGMQVLAPAPGGWMNLPDGCIGLEHAYTEVEERGSGVGTALLRHGLAWARETGYERCATDWVTANLLASRFWPRMGFRALSYQLCRRIDERTASHLQ